MKYLKNCFLILFVLIVGTNLSVALFLNDPFLVAHRRLLSLSSGERYYGRLSLWYLYAQKGDWITASTLESKLDPIDLLNYKKLHQPQELKKLVNSLIFKDNKTTDDWVELARIQLILGNLGDATTSITRAHQLDPIRSDIESIYYQLNK